MMRLNSLYFLVLMSVVHAEKKPGEPLAAVNSNSSPVFPPASVTALVPNGDSKPAAEVTKPKRKSPSKKRNNKNEADQQHGDKDGVNGSPPAKKPARSNRSSSSRSSRASPAKNRSTGEAAVEGQTQTTKPKRPSTPRKPRSKKQAEVKTEKDNLKVVITAISTAGHQQQQTPILTSLDSRTEKENDGLSNGPPNPLSLPPMSISQTS